MQNPLTFFTARNNPALLKYFNESAPIRCSTSSTLRPEAISSERLAMSIPMKQGHWIGGPLTRKWTSLVPAPRHSSHIFFLGVPRTLDPSTSHTRLPARVSACGYKLDFL